MKIKLTTAFTIVRVILTVVILYFIWTNAHWSIALFATLNAFAVEGLAAAIKLHAKIIKAQEAGIQAAMQSFDEKVGEFNKFVESINSQAEEMREKIKKVRVVPITGGVLRTPRVKPTPPPFTRPQCPQCLESGFDNTQNISGNCPIHD